MSTKNNEDIRLVRVDRLEPGMVVARDIHTDEGIRLLSEGDELTLDDIDRLKQWNKRSIYIIEPENGNTNSDSNDAKPYPQAS